MTDYKKYTDEFNLVNQILAEWNPIGLPEGITESGYTMYVPNILKFRNDYNGLVIELDRIVTEVIGLTIDNFDETYKQETLVFANSIIETLKNSELISNSELFDAVENDNADNKIKARAALLLSAINDYPTLNLAEPVDFLNELKNEIGSPLSYDLINNFEKKLTFDIRGNTWKKEALTSVLEMFAWDKTKTLDELIKEISIHYKLNPADKE